MTKKSLWGLLFGILFLSTSVAWSQTHKGINFQGVIKIPNGAKFIYPNETGITVNSKILSTNNCILLEEEFLGVNISNGYINLTIGTGSRIGADPNLPLSKVMDNSKEITGLVCLNSNRSVNPSVTSFDAALTGSNGSRKLRIDVTVGGYPVIADFNMKAVAFALNSETLNGKTDTDFIKVNSSKNVKQDVLENFFSASLVQDIVTGTYNAPTASSAITISGNIPATQVTGLSPIATSGSYNDLVDVPVLGTGANLNAPATGNATATQLVKGDDTRLVNAVLTSTSLSGDLSGNLPSPTVTGFKNQSITAQGSSVGQVLKYTGSNNWTPGFVTMFDLRSTVTGTQAFNGAGCLAHQTLTWTSLTDNLYCTDISISSSKVTGLASSATVNTTDASNITSGELPLARLPASVVNSLWSESSGNISRATGNVGIGAAAGTEKLEVNGKVKANNFVLVDTTAVEGATCVDGSIGRDASGNLYICN